MRDPLWLVTTLRGQHVGNTWATRGKHVGNTSLHHSYNQFIGSFLNTCFTMLNLVLSTRYIFGFHTGRLYLTISIFADWRDQYNYTMDLLPGNWTDVAKESDQLYLVDNGR